MSDDLNTLIAHLGASPIELVSVVLAAIGIYAAFLALVTDLWVVGRVWTGARRSLVCVPGLSRVS